MTMRRMLDPNDFINPATQRVLAFVAHPDDLDFGVAGTVVTMTANLVLKCNIA